MQSEQFERWQRVGQVLAAPALLPWWFWQELCFGALNAIYEVMACCQEQQEICRMANGFQEEETYA